VISVIVPAYNAAATLPACLQALKHQTIASAEYEIIVVDDGSTDNTAELARQLNVRVISQPNQGPAAARNAGVEIARGDIVLFTDADCEPLPDWIEQMIAPFKDLEVAGVKGVYRTRQCEWMARFVQFEYEDKYDRMREQDTIDFIDTYSAGYRRDIFILNHGFDPIMRELEDQELSFRLAQKGYRLVFAPQAAVYHWHNRTLKSYFKRKFEIGYWKMCLARWHPDKLVKDSHTPQVMKVQIGLVALMLMGLPASLLWHNALWGCGMFLLMFVLTTLPFTLKTAHHDRLISLFAPFFLWVRALALGFGLLIGLIAHKHRAETRKPVLTVWQRSLKRALDVILGSVLLILSAPVWAISALAIKLDSHGPAFFVQKRVGENGRVFNCYKLRTMIDGAATLPVDRIGTGAIGAARLKLPNDPRVTRIGRILRRTSLDETPQFINVLRGEMSLVGPRPEEVAIVACYNDWHRKRLAIKPGITGPMQINGRGDLSLDERVRLELNYIEHYSLAKDLVIMAKTIPVVIRGNGSY
jgi:lipopolysaccharide/colanic/teichoic acid biosynthesis glycosyltransferase/GT2 family glycosyltransferase